MVGQPSDFDSVLKRVKDNHHMFFLFMEGVARFFETHPRLLSTTPPAVHSVKSRIKDLSHLRGKLERQNKRGIVVNEDNCFREITDIAGVRVIHLYQGQLRDIDSVIRGEIFGVRIFI